MPAPSPRSFQVESPPRAKALLLAVVVPLGLILNWFSAASLHDPTLSAILPFAGMLTAVAAFLWPRHVLVGRDGAVVEGFFRAYRSWDRVASVRVERGHRGRGAIVLAGHDGSRWTITPHWDVDVPVLAAEMDAKRRAFVAGEFAEEDPQDASLYRVASLEPHVRVLVDPRSALDERLRAIKTIESVDPARADRLVDELLEDTADPRTRRALERS